MTPRKRPKWTPRLRRWVIKQVLANITPVSEIARNRNVSRRSIYMLLKRYTDGGFGNLEPAPRGRKLTPLNKRFEQMIFAKYIEFPKGSHKLWLELTKEGFGA